jgi:hypothetical protein
MQEPRIFQRAWIGRDTEYGMCDVYVQKYIQIDGEEETQYGRMTSHCLYPGAWLTLNEIAPELKPLFDLIWTDEHIKRAQGYFEERYNEDGSCKLDDRFKESHKIFDPETGEEKPAGGGCCCGGN